MTWVNVTIGYGTARLTNSTNYPAAALEAGG